MLIEIIELQDESGNNRMDIIFPLTKKPKKSKGKETREEARS